MSGFKYIYRQKCRQNVKNTAKYVGNFQKSIFKNSYIYRQKCRVLTSVYYGTFQTLSEYDIEIWPQGQFWGVSVGVLPASWLSYMATGDID